MGDKANEFSEPPSIIFIVRLKFKDGTDTLKMMKLLQELK